MKVHFAFGEDVPDLLLDNLIVGFDGAATWWPPRRHINSIAPMLNTPMIQCWGTPSAGTVCSTLDWLSQATDGDVLVATHRVEYSDRERLTTLASTARHVPTQRLVAIDAYDKPCFAWRDAAKAAGFKVFAREAPRVGEVPIDYAFNPLWAPRQAFGRREIQILFVGDMGVGRRQTFADAVGGQYPETRVGWRMSFDAWQAALAAAQVVVVAHGAGEATYRLWEAAAAGCALLIERFVARPAPEGLVDGETCLFFDGTVDPDAPDGIRAKAQTLLYQAGLSTRLGIAAREEAWTRHTPQAQTARLLREIAR